MSAEFFECQGWDPNRSSLYKANAMGAASTSWRPGGDPSSAAYANGWERKLPDCDNCDNGDGAAEADCSVGDENPQCNEGEWPDKDHCLVCGDCENQQPSLLVVFRTLSAAAGAGKVLVNNFNSRYGGICANYCRELGKTCKPPPKLIVARMTSAVGLRCLDELINRLGQVSARGRSAMTPAPSSRRSPATGGSPGHPTPSASARPTRSRSRPTTCRRPTRRQRSASVGGWRTTSRS